MEICVTVCTVHTIQLFHECRLDRCPSSTRYMQQTPSIHMATSCIRKHSCSVVGIHLFAKEEIGHDHHQAGGGELVSQLTGSIAISVTWIVPRMSIG